MFLWVMTYDTFGVKIFLTLIIANTLNYYETNNMHK